MKKRILIIALHLVVASLVAQMPLQISDTARLLPIGYRNFRDTPAGPVLAASFQHVEGLTYLYTEGRQFRNRVLRTEYIELRLRYIGIDGAITEGPMIERQFASGSSRFVGSREVLAWTALEAVPANELFTSVITRLYDTDGANYASVKIHEYQRELTEVYSIRSKASRHGTYFGTAVLTSVRSDRRGVREERGAILTVVIADTDGNEVYRKTQRLPDRRGSYEVKEFLVDESGEALIFFERIPWRALPPTREDPLIPIYETLAVSNPDDDFEPEPLLLGNTQLHQFRGVDADPWPVSIIASYGYNLASPTRGLRIHRLGDPVVTLDLGQDLLRELPEVLLEPKRSVRKQLSLQYDLIEAAVAPDGTFHVLFADRFAPVTQFSPQRLQQIRLSDGFMEGAVLIKFETSSADFRSPMVEVDQEAYVLQMRQRGGRSREFHFRSATGIQLVPIKDERFGILYNEELRNLEPLTKKQQKWTALEFSVPVLASPDTEGSFVREVLPYEQPHQFPLRVYPNRRHVLPSGTLIEFGAEEPSFKGARQWGWFGW